MWNDMYRVKLSWKYWIPVRKQSHCCAWVHSIDDCQLCWGVGKSTGGVQMSKISKINWILIGYGDVFIIQICLVVPNTVKPEQVIHQTSFGRRNCAPQLNCSTFNRNSRYRHLLSSKPVRMNETLLDIYNNSWLNYPIHQLQINSSQGVYGFVAK